MKFTIAVLALLSGAEARHHHQSIAEKMMVNLQVKPDPNYYENYDTFFLPKRKTDQDLQAEKEYGDRGMRHWLIKTYPNKVFGAAEGTEVNTQFGMHPWQSVDLHDDEPVAMGETTLESSDDEKGDDEEISAEDQKNHEALIKRVENAHSQKPPSH